VCPIRYRLRDALIRRLTYLSGADQPDTSLSIMTRLCAGQVGKQLDVRLLAGALIFLLSETSEPAVGPTQPRVK
jgi:hypothetical protein